MRRRRSPASRPTRRRSQPTYHPPTGPPRRAHPDAAGGGQAGGSSNLATSMLKILFPAGPGRGAARRGQDRPGHRQRHHHPGRAGLRHHATPDPDPGGTEIADNRSINGTFVNGARVDTALLDEVTSSRSATSTYCSPAARWCAAPRPTRATGGLDVRAVTWTIENHKTLLDNISLTARPGTLTR